MSGVDGASRTAEEKKVFDKARENDPEGYRQLVLNSRVEEGQRRGALPPAEQDTVSSDCSQ